MMKFETKDERIWQYRRTSPDGATESHLFASRRDIPAGEGWADSRGEALGVPVVVAPQPNAFAELSIADQVAALEAAALAAGDGEAVTVDPDAPVEGDAPHPHTDAAKPRKGRKKKE